jgi:hypothetical protein
MHSGGSKILGQEFVQCEVDVHNDIVILVVQEKKRLFEDVAASSKKAQEIPDATGSDTACTADANLSETDTPVAKSTAEASSPVSVNQPGPLHNPPPPPPLQELPMPLSISDVTIAQATQIMQAAKFNARALKTKSQRGTRRRRHKCPAPEEKTETCYGGSEGCEGITFKKKSVKDERQSA